MAITKNRPVWNDEMKKELAEIVGKQVNEWCNNETPVEDCIEAAEKVLRYNSNDNGYELAKEFEDEGFSPDPALVEILEGVSYDRQKILEKFIKNWVIENSLKLDLAVEQKVTAKIARKGEVECEIMKLYPETMQYGLWYEGIGYPKAIGHAIVNYENVVKLIMKM